jgi:hypothetical protein
MHYNSIKGNIRKKKALERVGEEPWEPSIYIHGSLT